MFYELVILITRTNGFNIFKILYRYVFTFLLIRYRITPITCSYRLEPVVIGIKFIPEVCLRVEVDSNLLVRLLLAIVNRQKAF